MDREPKKHLFFPPGKKTIPKHSWNEHESNMISKTCENLKNHDRKLIKSKQNETF
jgi:hypothetical protein